MQCPELLPGITAEKVSNTKQADKDQAEEHDSRNSPTMRR